MSLVPMGSKMLLLLAFTLTSSLSIGSCYSIPKVTLGEDIEESHGLFENDFIEEPTYQPRFLPFFGGGESNNSTGNKTLQENLVNAAADLALKTFGGDETVKKIIEVIRNPGNKTVQESLLDIAFDLATSKFGGDDTLKKLIEVFKNPDNKTLQSNLLNLAADLALKKFGNDEVLQQVVYLFQNPENKTLQENVLNLAAEVALKAFNGDDTIKRVIEVFQNPGNKTLQENMLNLASEVAIKKLGVDPSLKRVFEVIQNPGNKTFQDNLLDIALDVALSRAGVDETLQKVAKTLLIPGNKTLHQNLISLATELTAQKGSQVFGNVLGSFLGNDSVAGAKQKVGAVGQALKVGGGFLGGFLTNIGGNSVLGKIGQAITGGSQAIGGVMTNIAGNNTAGAEIGMIANALQEGNITLQDAFKQATTVVSNAGNVPADKGTEAVLSNLVVDGTTEYTESSTQGLDSKEQIEGSVSEIKNSDEAVKEEALLNDKDYKKIATPIADNTGDGVKAVENNVLIANEVLSEISKTGTENFEKSSDYSLPNDGFEKTELLPLEESKPFQIGEITSADGSTIQTTETGASENALEGSEDSAKIKGMSGLGEEVHQIPEVVQQNEGQFNSVENIGGSAVVGLVSEDQNGVTTTSHSHQQKSVVSDPMTTQTSNFIQRATNPVLEANSENFGSKNPLGSSGFEQNVGFEEGLMSLEITTVKINMG